MSAAVSTGASHSQLAAHHMVLSAGPHDRRPRRCRKRADDTDRFFLGWDEWRRQAGSRLDAELLLGRTHLRGSRDEQRKALKGRARLCGDERRTSRSRLGGMTAQIGADGLDLLGNPCPELLIDVALVQPEPGRDWVNLEDRRGFRSTQRLRSAGSPTAW